MAVRKLVVMEDAVLQSMAVNSAFLKEFSFLSSITKAPKGRGCGSCGANNERKRIFAAARESIAAMTAEKKRKLKELLNAQQVRVRCTRSNKPIDLTF